MDEVEAQSTAASTNREAAIESFLRQFADSENGDLLAEMMVTICRLAHDGTDRGELKLLSKAFKELRYAFKVFAPHTHIRKVSIFGSARTPMNHPDYVQADRFARRMREEDWMVITGAGDGIMRAGHDGAGREASFGVAIRLPFEQETNIVIAEDPKLINFKYFFTRKLLFIKEASAVALFPGGFGTQDEGFEALTLIQTGKSNPIPIVMVDPPGGTYWQHWMRYLCEELLNKGMISEQDLHLFRVTDDAEVAVQEILQFYRRYHSMRYVREVLALRIRTRVEDETLERLNDTFGDIVTRGRIGQRSGPMSGENGAWPELARITLRFNRRDVGRLRLLIDEINRA